MAHTRQFAAYPIRRRRHGQQPGTLAPREISNVSGSFSFGPYGSFSLSYIRQDNRDKPDVALANASYNVSPGRIGALNLGYFRSLKGLPDDSVALTFTFSLDEMLTEEEWTVMRSHTVIGAQLCSNLKGMKLTVPIIQSHHERWDGSGYPDGLKGEAIPFLARVFQFADIFDALSSRRSYKPALSFDEVISIWLA